MLPESLAITTYEVTKTDPDENSFGEFGTDPPYYTDLQARNPTKKRFQPHLAPGLEPKNHPKSNLLAVQLKQRNSSNEKPIHSPTLDRIFGGNFKVVDVFTVMRDSSGEHFPEDPITRRLSPRKQNNFEIAEADEEEEDIKESRRGNRDTLDKKSNYLVGIPQQKGSFLSFSQPKIVKSQTMAQLDETKSPFDDKEITLRASRVKFYPRQNDDLAAGNKQLSVTKKLLAQLANPAGSSRWVPKKKNNRINSYIKLQSTCDQQESPSQGRNRSKISDSNILPPLNLVLESTPLELKVSNRGRKLKKDFFKTQTNFTQSNFDGYYSPVGRSPLEHFESRRNEKENIILQQKPYIDVKFKDEGMQLIEKYADRFQLNVDELTNKKSKGTIGKSSDRINLAISTARISTPFKNIQFDTKPIAPASMRGSLARKSKFFFDKDHYIILKGS